MSSTTIGVLALQGDVREHIQSFSDCGVSAKEVRLPRDLEDVDGLVIPGGESTTIGDLLVRYDLVDAILQRHADGMAIWGTCAGAIILAKHIEGTKKRHLGLLDITIKRNAYGRQQDSFETQLEVEGIGALHGVFIRAPIITKAGREAEVLSSLNGKPVLVRQGNLMASTFHPEISGSTKVHEYFLENCVGR